MFEVVDDVLITYQNYSKQIFSITNQHKDDIGQASDSGDNTDLLK